MVQATAIFRQSEIKDPYAFYSRMLEEQPVFWDEANQIWAVYRHADCSALLLSTRTRIPFPHSSRVAAAMSDLTKTVVASFARFSNSPEHQLNREAALQMFARMREINHADEIDFLLNECSPEKVVDWVAICKKLPSLSILRAFEFNQASVEIVLPKVEALTKLITPATSELQMTNLNSVVEDVYGVIEQHLYDRILSHDVQKETLAVCAANVIGLLIQSFDAVRGLLSNSLLQMLKQVNLNALDKSDRAIYEPFVEETLRFDPPVHNTRRIISETIVIRGKELKEGQTVLIVLAAANRDPAKFNLPDDFDIRRTNNTEHLTFGTGQHACVAARFSVKLASETLFHLFGRNRKVELLTDDISYEPLVNLRLPVSVLFKM